MQLENSVMPLCFMNRKYTDNFQPGGQVKEPLPLPPLAFATSSSFQIGLGAFAVDFCRLTFGAGIVISGDCAITPDATSKQIAMMNRLWITPSPLAAYCVTSPKTTKGIPMSPSMIGTFYATVLTLFMRRGVFAFTLTP